jgi:hypothetical protein
MTAAAVSSHELSIPKINISDSIIQKFARE